MPSEPAPNRWSLPDPRTAPADQELLAVGADLAPGTMLAGYRTGIFPMGLDDVVLGWWSPQPRGILRPADFHASRSLARTLRRFELTVDQAFSDVVAGCADPQRPHGWITEEFKTAYASLHALGWAHSVEAWSDGELAGGLFGIEIGGLFAAESMFHTRTDASKAALFELTRRLGAAEPAERRIIDVQWATAHLRTLGVTEVTRTEYLDLLPEALSLPSVLSDHR